MDSDYLESDQSLDLDVSRHYGRGGIVDNILLALQGSGKDTRDLTIEDLKPMDEFHIRGREATIELAQKLHLDSSMHVLDVGCGIGGPSRYLAHTYGCRVTGLDLTEEFIKTAEILADWVGLQDKVTYRQGNALNMPFSDKSFDRVITQHASMNIADKETLYLEIYRVLRSGGLFGMYDLLSGPEEGLYFPVPWASEPYLSHLIEPEPLRNLLKLVGFQIISWRDTTEQAIAAFTAMVNENKDGRRVPPGITAVQGPEFVKLAENTVRSMKEKRLVAVEAVLRRPDKLPM